MLVKIDFRTEDTYEIREKWNYRISKFDSEANDEYVTGVFMCKPMDKSIQKELAVLTRHNLGATKFMFSEKNLVGCNVNVAISEIFLQELDTHPIIVGLHGNASMSNICSSFEKLLRYKDYDIDFMFGFYDCRRIYKHGQYYGTVSLFDSVMDYKDKMPLAIHNLSINTVCDYLQYAVRIRPGLIEIMSGTEAKKEFKEFYKSNYKYRKRMFRRSHVEERMEFVDSLVASEYPQLTQKTVRLFEGSDCLKMDFPDDKLTVVFNTSVEDEVWTVDTFKNLIGKVLLGSGEYDGQVDINVLLRTRQFELNNMCFNKLVLSECQESYSLADRFYYETSVQNQRNNEKMVWCLDESLKFSDEYEKFVSHVCNGKYKQYSAFGFESIEYKNTYCVGNDEECGYLIYTY